MFCWQKRCFYKWANTEMAIRSFPLNPDLELLENPECWPLGPTCPERSLACVIDRARQMLSGQPRAPCCFAWRRLEFMPFQLFERLFLFGRKISLTLFGLTYLCAWQVFVYIPNLLFSACFSFKNRVKKKRIHIHTFNFNLP